MWTFPRSQRCRCNDEYLFALLLPLPQKIIFCNPSRKATPLKTTSRPHFFSSFVRQVFALANCLPGPSAAQVVLNGVTVGTGSVVLGLLACVLFMIPGAFALGLFGVYVGSGGNGETPAMLSLPWVVNMQEGVGLAAISLIATGAFELSSKLVSDRLTKVLYSGTVAITLIFTTVWWTTPLCLILGGAASFVAATITGFALAVEAGGTASAWSPPSSPGLLSPRAGASLFAAPLVLLIACLSLEFFLPALTSGSNAFRVILIFFRCGSLVFGGGPVVVPILLDQLVPPGLLTSSQFLLGFGAVSMLPGPMFNVAAFCGGVVNGSSGALLCWVAMVLPGTAMSVGALPLWSSVRSLPMVKVVLKGVNACAAGLMAAAFVNLWIKLVGGEADGTAGTAALSANARAAAVVTFISSQVIFGAPSQAIIVAGVAFGLAVAHFSS